MIDEPTSLYRLFSDAGALLYVGIAGNPGRRFEQHQGEKPWWGEVSRVDVEHFATRLEATVAEVKAIRSERPLYNVAHNAGRGVVLPPAPASSDLTRWSFESRRSGIERVCRLWLYAELDLSSAVDDCDSADGEDQLRFYVRTVQHRAPEWLATNAVPIAWFVDSDEVVFEAAPFQVTPGGRDHFLSHYTWPVDDDGARIDWFRLKVRTDRFPAFADALGWRPSPLQPTCPIRDILASRSGRNP